MNKSSFFIVGKHPVIEALKNPKRKVLRIFLTEEAKKTIHRESSRKNLLKDIKVFFKTKKELDKYSTKENLLHQGYVAEIEHLEKPSLKNLIKEKSSVSKKVAKSMAEKVSEKFNSDFAISSTGFASETKNKECTVGQVYIGLKTPKSIVVNEFLFSGDRHIIISQVKDKAFEMLIDHIKKAE